jgi:hypothetical protein
MMEHKHNRIPEKPNHPYYLKINRLLLMLTQVFAYFLITTNTNNTKNVIW